MLNSVASTNLQWKDYTTEPIFCSQNVQYCPLSEMSKNGVRLHSLEISTLWQNSTSLQPYFQTVQFTYSKIKWLIYKHQNKTSMLDSMARTLYRIHWWGDSSTLETLLQDATCYSCLGVVHDPQGLFGM